MSGWSSTHGAILSQGAQWIEEECAFSFSLCSRHAEGVTLLRFGGDDPSVPLLEHRLDPRVNKTWHIWNCRLRDHEVRGACYYAYRIDGPRPSGPRDWHAFDPQKVLLDPFANGIPMMAAGDEFLHTQHGNNNPYNHHNETAGLDWSLEERHADHLRFVTRMIAFRKAHPTLARPRIWRDDV